MYGSKEVSFINLRHQPVVQVSPSQQQPTQGGSRYYRSHSLNSFAFLVERGELLFVMNSETITVIDFESIEHYETEKLYKLCIHERKKKYWEQLELRCRHLYRRPPPPHGLGNHGNHINSSMLVTPGSQCGYCTTTTGKEFHEIHMNTRKNIDGFLW